MVDKKDKKPKAEKAPATETATATPPKPSSATKKKKGKKGASQVDVSKYAPLVEATSWPIAIQYSSGKGRHAVAKDDLKPGTIICTERAATLVVSTPCVGEFCHRCVGSLAKAQILDRRVDCPTCKKTSYCSPACQKADATRHVLECSIVPQLAEIATKHDINVDLLRLTLSLLVARVLEERRAKLSASGKQATNSDGPIAPWWAINELPLHPQVFDKTWIKSVTAAAKAMSEILPAPLAATPQQIVDLSCRINTNAHSLSDDEEKTADTAFGLFPLGSLFFKHSCAPNCHFTADKGVLTYRTIKQVKAGEELLVSHIELFQPRSTRRQELMTTKQIKCDCTRCRIPLRKSVDRFLDGVLCDRCHKGVYLAESEFTAQEIAKKDEEMAAAQQAEKRKREKALAGEAKKDSKTNGTNGTTADEKIENGSEVKTEDDEKTVDAEEKKDEMTEAQKKEIKEREEYMKKRAFCDSCSHSKQLFEVEILRIQVQRDYQEIFQFVQKKAYKHTIQYFRLFLDKYQGSRLLHPYHTYLVNAHLPLLTALKQVQDYTACLSVVKHVIDIYETSNVVAPLRHEFVELYQELGSILQLLSVANKLDSGPRGQHRGTGEILERRYKREATEAYRKAYDVCRVCLGEDSPKTAELKRKAKV
ncbi:hypothetical protein DFS34DRAFT_630444 [Phlyctochytrium arcticum]|nr:hypothetical protein DFS34DRAFT_630444 [Phlyctochytrium arcticum]